MVVTRCGLCVMGPNPPPLQHELPWYHNVIGGFPSSRKLEMDERSKVERV